MTLDQILLLNGFEKWGFGNWGEVKDYMGFNGANFSKDELRNHYDNYYLSNEQMMPTIPQQLIQNSKKNNKILEIRKVQYQDKINQAQKLQQSRPEICTPKFRQRPIPKTKQPNILGYNPKRKSFLYDIEYDDKAQSLLSDLEFRDDDTPEQTQLKFKILENFNHRQTERLKRYQFTIRHHILDIDYRFKQEISANKYQKDAFNSFRKFTRFQSHEENEETRSLIAKNNYIKSMIQGLRKCRKKLDESGRIQETLEELKKKDQSLEKLGMPRKIFKIDITEENAGNQEYLIRTLQATIKSNRKKQSEQEPPHLQIVYRSPQFSQLFNGSR